jgi:hypothetical protein
MQMPKNDNNENMETPAEYTPAAPEAAAQQTENVTPIEEGRKRRLGTGAIIGISAAGVALLAGVFGGGMAVANVIDHNGRPPAGMAGQDLSQMKGELQSEAGEHKDGARDGDRDGDGGHHGKRGHGPQAGMAGGVQGGLEADGSMPGNVPHEHDANGNDIIPEGYPTTTPAPTTN